MKRDRTYSNDDWDRPKKQKKKTQSERKMKKYKNYFQLDETTNFEKIKRK